MAVEIFRRRGRRGDQVGPGALEIACLLVQQPALHQRGRYPRLESDRRVVIRDRTVGIAPAFPGKRAMVEGACIVRLKLDCAVEIGDGAIEIALLSPRRAAVAVDAGIAGVQCERRVEILDGVIEVAGEKAQDAPVDMRRQVVRVEPDDLAPIGDGAVAVSGFGQDAGASLIGGRGRRIETDRLAVIRERGVLRVLPVTGVAAPKQDLGELGAGELLRLDQPGASLDRRLRRAVAGAHRDVGPFGRCGKAEQDERGDCNRERNRPRYRHHFKARSASGSPRRAATRYHSAASFGFLSTPRPSVYISANR